MASHWRDVRPARVAERLECARGPCHVPDLLDEPYPVIFAGWNPQVNLTCGKCLRQRRNVRMLLWGSMSTTGKESVVAEVMDQLNGKFKLTPVEWIGPDTPRSFNLRLSDWHSEGWRLLSEPGEVHQGDREARQIKGGETHPVPKILEGEDEENPKGETVRTVQGVVGEMLWLSTRTRPDGCYATALIARLVHRRPTYALQLCQHLLRYVASTASLGLHYDGGSANWNSSCPS